MLFSAHAPERNAMCAPGEVQTEAGINLMGKRQLGFEFISGAERKLLFFSSHAYAAFKAIFAGYFRPDIERFNSGSLFV